MEIDFEDLAGATELQQHPQSQVAEQELDAAKRKRKLIIPTQDSQVRLQLRNLNEPITLFGERPGDRRDRLRDIVAKIKERRRQAKDSQDSDSSLSSSGSSSGSDQEQEFYTPGGIDLLQARKRIAQYSLARARKRVARQRLEADLPLGSSLSARKAVFAELRTYTTLGTQLADDRPVSIVRFSPNSQYLATGSWSGAAKIWDVPHARCLGVFKGHGVDRVGGLAWHPAATLSQSTSAVNFATGAGDGKINLWPLSDLKDPSDDGSQPEAILKPLASLTGHAGRVCRVAFHPSGHTLASAGYDETWRLWDIEKQKELMIQEGHSKEVYAVAFQPDGALLCSGGLDAIGRVWDLRSGKTVMILDGHSQDVLAIDFSPIGHQIATGSNDDTVRIWDMRTLKSIYTIAAHASTVSDLSFFRSDSGNFPFTLTHASSQANGTDAKDQNETQKGQQVVNASGQPGAVKPPLDGMYLVTSGFDGMVKFWSADDWQLQKAISSEQGGKVLSVDMSRDGRYVASGQYMRTFRLLAASGVEL